MVEFENMEQREVLETPNLEESPNETLDRKLRAYFDGKIVRKDLTKSIKEGANVPVYVLEFLLGQYCSSDDQSVIDEGIHNVKKILADNFVRPDEAQKILSILRERGSYTVIDKLTVKLNIKEDRYEAEFSNLGIKNIPIQPEYASKYDRLLCGGIWCIVQLEYEFVEEDKRVSPIRIYKLTPIQMPHIDMDEVKNGRKAFTKEEWLTIMLRSSGMEPDNFPERVKWLLLARMVPLVENNFNYCELGPRSTGKSHIYKEISPNSILVSGGQTSVANLFYNIGTKTVGLVGMWDCVAFDEIAGINFKDKDGVQIMKDYMASGSFARGKEEKSASASMVFVGNINQDVSVLLKTSHLFEPFPDAMAYDTAFLDRIHCYLPGWEIPKFRPNSFTNDYGFITDYLSEFLRELRKESFGDALDKYFKLGSNLNQRDTIAVRKMVSGMLKLLYPDGDFGKVEVREVLTFALEMRRRVKEQLKKIGGMEFYDVNFSFVDNDSFEETFVSVPEQGGGKTAQKNVVVTTDYSTVIAFFAATINITYPAGSTCTCSDGTMTLSAPDTSGTWVCTVPNAGTWTVSSTDGDKSKNADVVITTDGQTESVTLQYITYLFKDGETYDSLTGGWQGTINSEKQALQLTAAAGKTSNALTGSKVDLTNFNTISAKTDSDLRISLNIIIASAIPSGQVATASLQGAETELSLDISSITGEYFVWLSAYSEKGATRYVYEVSMQ